MYSQVCAISFFFCALACSFSPRQPMFTSTLPNEQEHRKQQPGGFILRHNISFDPSNYGNWSLFYGPPRQHSSLPRSLMPLRAKGISCYKYYLGVQKDITGRVEGPSALLALQVETPGAGVKVAGCFFFIVFLRSAPKNSFPYAPHRTCWVVGAPK